ncbi:MAG TPA: SUMF1/EgtB/PvdO family nonheme iron enzyme [Polyangiaceae bacterium]|nr:SUMF1/EgtB/PvdO family nonheme iron enzyme [Polyangiaceae bacterium]
MHSPAQPDLGAGSRSHRVGSLRLGSLRVGSLPLFIVAGSVSLLLASSCSAAAKKPPPAPQQSSSAGSAASAGTGAPASSAARPGATAAAGKPGAAAAPTGKPAADEDEGPESCPDDMVLVEGDYCTVASNPHQPDEHGNTAGMGAPDMDVVEHECQEEWYAEQNKKRVCEKFAEGKSACKGKLVKKRYCIDPYTWPNVKGAMPEVMNRYHQAQVKCVAVGKRLCTESEWTLACEGPERKPFPYGYDRDTKKCHGDLEWDAPNMTKVAARDPIELRRLYQAKPNGEPECVGEYGVYDLPGNTDEIVASETFERRGKYESVTTGGPWYKGVRNQCRPKIYTHDEGFYYYYLGFRCCSDADGAENEPLTPHQQKEGWDMKRVERLAGISVKEMRDLLEKKKKDPTCGCTTTKCRTFCGTLMSDEAVEAAKKKR